MVTLISVISIRKVTVPECVKELILKKVIVKVTMMRTIIFFIVYEDSKKLPMNYFVTGNLKRTYTDNRLDRLTGPVDSSLDLNCEGNTNTKSSNSNPIERELDNVKKELEKLKKFNPFKKK